MKRSKKRTLVMVLLLLTGGAIINVAVAWGCANADFKMTSRVLEPSTIRDLMRAQKAADWSKHSGVYAVQKHHFGFQRTDFSGEWPFLILRTAGWPMLCFYDEFPLTPPFPASWIIGGAGRGEPGFAVPDSAFHSCPQQILWPGFAINTVFYAAVLWLLFAAPGFVRRRIRARRGQCPACAYPIGASDVCTECGKAIMKR